MIVVQIAGRLGKDADSRFTTSGQKVTTMTVATNIRKAGKDETVWWRVTIWGDRYDKMMPYLKKGSAIIVVGEMNMPNIWTDKEGRPQVNLELTAEIVRFSPFGGPERPGEEKPAGAQSTTSYGSDNAGADDSNPPVGAGSHASSSGYGAAPTAGRYNPPTQSEDQLPF